MLDQKVLFLIASYFGALHCIIKHAKGGSVKLFIAFYNIHRRMRDALLFLFYPGYNTGFFWPFWYT
jgi:hypothetical protein